MEAIKRLRKERNYSFQFIADLLGASVGHIQNICNGRIKEVGPEIEKQAKDVERLLHLIDGEPQDLILLKYELSQLTGLSIKEMEAGEKKAERKAQREAQKDAQLTGLSIEELEAGKKAERKIELQALKDAPQEPSNLRLCTLETLENLRENGYKSVYRPNVSYDANAVDAEIARKKFNAKRKKEIYLQKMALRA